MEKSTLKIENVFSAIVNSHSYDSFSSSYDSNQKAQKAFLETIMLPKITEEVQNIIDSNSLYKSIQIGKITIKYTKDFKTLSIDLDYTDNNEYIICIQDTFKKFKWEMNCNFTKWNLYVL